MRSRWVVACLWTGLWAVALGAFGTVHGAPPYGGDGEATVVFDIPKMTVKDALMRFAQQTSTPLLVSIELVTTIEANALMGEFTVAISRRTGVFRH